MATTVRGEDKSSEGFPSGQWEQAVNLPAFAFVGSNPTPSTVLSARGRPSPRTFGSPVSGHLNPRMLFLVCGSLNPQVLWFAGSLPANGRRRIPNRMQTKLRSPLSAGVAQLVERQPSKLNVASSSLVSRSVSLLDFGAPTPKSGRSAGAESPFRRALTPKSRLGAAPARHRSAKSLRAAESATRQDTTSSAGPLAPVNPRSSTTSKQAPFESSSQMRNVAREPARSVLGTRGPEAQRDQADGRDLEGSFQQEPTFRSIAHLAQLVEHVLGKDEVTSSILVVGSEQLQSREWRASSVSGTAPTVN